MNPASWEAVQIPIPVKIFRVFPDPATYFGQIPDPENTLPDPVQTLLVYEYLFISYFVNLFPVYVLVFLTYFCLYNSNLIEFCFKIK